MEDEGSTDGTMVRSGDGFTHTVVEEPDEVRVRVRVTGVGGRGEISGRRWWCWRGGIISNTTITTIAPTINTTTIATTTTSSSSKARPTWVGG